MNKSSKKRKKSLAWLSYILVIAISASLTLVVSNAARNDEAAKSQTLTGSRAPDGRAGSDGNSLLNQAADQNQNQATDQNRNQAANKEITFIDNWYMNTRTEFVMDGIWHRMGNIGEILDTVKNIRHTSELSWFREWNKTAERVKAIGDESLSKNHEISAGDAYLRAANYYLAAEVFLHTNPDDPRILETYKKGADAFIKGLTLLKEPVSIVQIPYENTTLKGYYFKAPGEGKKPVLIVHQGFDAPVESTKYIAEEAVKRGYSALLLEGPGQGLSIREKKLTFRPDWENVISPVIDYLLTRSDVDGDNIMLMGLSMGGGFATRAAEYEKRLKLVIVDPGYTDLYKMVSDLLGPKLINLYEQDPKECDKKMLELTRYDVGLRWGVNHGMWVFGGKTPSEFLTKLKEYNYTKDVDKIQTMMLVMDGTKETWGKGEAKALYDALKGPKDYMLFTEEDTAATHCQGRGPAIMTQRLFDWLEEHVDKGY